MAQLMDWAKSGTLSVHVHATYPLEDYRKAFEAIAKRQVLGKTLLSFGAARGLKPVEIHVAMHNIGAG